MWLVLSFTLITIGLIDSAFRISALRERVEELEEQLRGE